MVIQKNQNPVRSATQQTANQSVQQSVQENQETVMSTTEADKEENKSRAEAMFKRAEANEQAELGRPASSDKLDVDITKATNGSKKATEPKSDKPKRIVPASDFIPTIITHMGQLDCVTIPMTFSQIYDYTGYEKSLYGVSEKALKNIPLRERFQRRIDSARVSDIANYITVKPHSFFGPILCVPKDEETYNELASVSSESGNGVNPVRLTQGCLLAIDGQHRRAGIVKAIEDIDGNDKEGSNKEVGSLSVLESTIETNKKQGNTTVVQQKQAELDRLIELLDKINSQSIPVVVVNIHPSNIAVKQQLFGDINKNARKVSKTVSTMFDHSDYAVNVAKWLSGMATEELGDGYTDTDLTDLIDLEKASPSRTTPKTKKTDDQGSAGAARTSKAITLTNLASFLKTSTKYGGKVNTKSGKSSLITALEEGKVELAEIGNLVSGIVNNMPEIEELRSGKSFGETYVRKYVVFNSSFWQAMGALVSQLVDVQLQRRDKCNVLSVIDSVIDWTKDMTNNDSWSVDDDSWHEDGQVVVVDRSVMNKQNVISYFAGILKNKYDAFRENLADSNGNDGVETLETESETDSDGVETEETVEEETE